MATNKTWQRTPPKLSPSKVREIREIRRDRRASIKSIAIRYGVSQETVRDAIRGEGAYRGL